MNAASSSPVADLSSGRRPAWEKEAGEKEQDVLTVLAGKQPDKPAVIDDRPDGTVESIAFAQFNRRVNKLANALMAGGLRQRAARQGERAALPRRASEFPVG